MGSENNKEGITRDNYPNLNRSNKWLGIIDYKSLVILLVLLFAIWNILGLFLRNHLYRVYILVIFLSNCSAFSLKTLSGTCFDGHFFEPLFS